MSEKIGNKLDGEEKLYDRAPSMFRNRPFWFIIWIVAIGGGMIGLFIFSGESQKPLWILSIMTMLIGGFILLSWWLRVVNTKLTVTNERVTFREGILSKNIREIYLPDIRSVQINQGLWQRIFGTGHLEIASAASSEAEIKIDGIPNPYEVKRIIDENRRLSRSKPD